LKSSFLHCLLVCSALLLTSCATPNFKERLLIAKEIALQAGFEKTTFQAPKFSLVGWKKITRPDLNTLIVYIEGDGKAWSTRFKISKNPTPVNPLTLHLAVNDYRPNILYLSRPCQFKDIELTKSCKAKYWTSHRYGKEIIDTYHEVFEQIKLLYNINEFKLIGYSGGGLVAALLSAQRNDIVNLMTVAANLDHIEWAAYHHVTPLTGSLNLFSFISGLDKIKQLHLWGENDSIVPVEVNQNVLKYLMKNRFVHYKIYNDFDHHCCWIEQWSTILDNHQVYLD